MSRLPDEAVVQRYGPMVYRLAFAQTRSQADADDVYQEVFLRYVDKSPEFQGEEHAKAWFLRVTLNCCRDLWRSPWRRRSAPLTEDLPFQAPEEWGLHQELVKLPKKYRAVLHLFYWEDMTTEEVAQALDLKPATVRQQLSRARLMLRKLLQEEDMLHV